MESLLQQVREDIQKEKERLDISSDVSSTSSFTDFMNDNQKHYSEMKEYLEDKQLPLMLDYKYNKEQYHQKAVDIIETIESENLSARQEQQQYTKKQNYNDKKRDKFTYDLIKNNRLQYMNFKQTPQFRDLINRPSDATFKEYESSMAQQAVFTRKKLIKQYLVEKVKDVQKDEIRQENLEKIEMLNLELSPEKLSNSIEKNEFLEQQVAVSSMHTKSHTKSTPKLMSKSSLRHLSTIRTIQEKSEDFIPFISERGNNGRIKIESVQNLVTKIGAKSNINLAEEKGRENYQSNKEKFIHKMSLRGMGVVEKKRHVPLESITERSNFTSQDIESSVQSNTNRIFVLENTTNNKYTTERTENDTFITATLTSEKQIETPKMNLIENFDNFVLKKSKNYVKDNIAYFSKLKEFKRKGSAESMSDDESEDQLMTKQLKNLQEQIQNNQNFNQLKDHEQQLLKLVHQFDKKTGIENMATEDNIQAIKKVLKTILDYRLHQTSRLRKFVMSGREIHSNSENKLSRNPSQIRTLSHKTPVDKYGLPNLSTNPSRKQIQLFNVSPSPGKYQTLDIPRYQSVQKIRSLARLDSLTDKLLIEPRPNKDLQNHYKQVSFPKNKLGGRSQFLIPVYKLKEIESNEAKHKFNNYQGDTLAYIQNRQLPVKEPEAEKSISCKRLSKVQTMENNLDLDQELTLHSMVHGRPKGHYTFSKNMNLVSHLGQGLYGELDQIQKEKKAQQMQRRQNLIEFQSQHLEEQKKKEMMQKVQKLQNSQQNYRLAEELREKYQMYSRYETGITQRYNQTQKDSLVLKKFLNNKLKQYIIKVDDD